MQLARVTGTLFATRKNSRFEGKKILVVREHSAGGELIGPSYLAVDRVDAGVGDLVLVNREGSSARLLFGDEQIPLQAVIVGVVDGVEWRREEPEGRRK